MNLLLALSNVLLQLAKCYVRVQSPEEGWGLLQAVPPNLRGTGMEVILLL